MAETKLSSVEIAREDIAFACLDTSGIPDQSTVTFTAAPVTTAFMFGGKEQRGLPRDFARNFAGFYPDEPEAPANRSGATRFGAADGERFAVYSGDIVLEHPLWTIGNGSPFAGYDDLPLTKTWRSSLGITLPPALFYTDGVNAGSGVNLVDVDTPGSWEDGQGVCRTILNHVEYGVISKINGAVITVNPAFSTAPAANSRLRACYTWHPVVGADSLALTSVAMRFIVDGRRAYAFGCRLKQLRFRVEGNTVICTQTFEPAIILRDDGAVTAAAWTAPGGKACTWSQGEHIIGSGVSDGAAAGAEIARTALSLSSWEATVDFSLAPVAGGSTSVIIGRSNTEVTDAQITIACKGEPSTTLRDMRRKMQTRMLVLGAGEAPAATDTASGYGFAVVVPAAALRKGADLEDANGHQLESFEFGASRWTGDNSTTKPAGTAFRLLMPW